MRAAQPSWREQEELPAFDIGPDGFPRPGQVIRHFRQTRLKADGKPWTQRDLAQILGCRELAVREMDGSIWNSEKDKKRLRVFSPLRSFSKSFPLTWEWVSLLV